MNGPREPFDGRRRTQLRQELVDRARLWLPDWRPRDESGDFALALFDIVARLEAEVTQRLDKIPQKVYRGFLHWLGLRGDAGRAARLPVVFQMAPGAEPVLARSPIQMQVTPPQTDTAEAPEPVTLETATDLMVSRGSLATLVAVDPEADAFFLTPAGFSALEAPAAGPETWAAQSEVGAGARQLQLEPELGLDRLPTIRHRASQTQYRIVAASGSLVTIEPPLAKDVAQDDRFEGLPTFNPFAPGAENRQEHALFLGSESVLNLPTEATIAVRGLGDLGANVEWSYWGKSEDSDENDWRTLLSTFERQQIWLRKGPGAIETLGIAGRESRWLRARTKGAVAAGTRGISTLQTVKLTVNCDPGKKPACPPAERSAVAVEGIAVTTPLVLDIPFYPLGREPRLFDAFYIGSPEALSKQNALVNICLESLDSTTSAYVVARLAGGPDVMLFSTGHGQLHRVRPGASPTDPIKRETSLRPPFAEDGTPSVVAPSSPLNDVIAGARLSTLGRTFAEDTLVAVTSRNDLWVWQQYLQAGASRWHSLGPIFPADRGEPPEIDPERPPHVILLADGSAIRLVGLNHETLYEASLPAAWEGSGVAAKWRLVEADADDDGEGDEAGADTWAHVVPIVAFDQPGAGGELADGWLAVSTSGEVVLFESDNSGNSTRTATLPIPRGGVALDVAPVAVRISSADVVLFAKQGDDLIAFPVKGRRPIVRLEDAFVQGAIDWFFGRAPFIVVFRRKASDDDPFELVTWYPLEGATGEAPVGTAYVSAPIFRTIGGPAAMTDRAILPGTRGAMISVPLTPSGLVLATIDAPDVQSALVFATSDPPFAIGDYLETKIEGEQKAVKKLTDTPNQSGARTWTRLSPANVRKPFVSAEVYRVRVQDTFDGNVASTSSSSTDVTLDAGDVHARNHPSVAITVTSGMTSVVSIHTIRPIAAGGPAPTVITVEPPIAGVTGGPGGTAVKYQYVKRSEIAKKILPLLNVGGLDASALDPSIANGFYLQGAKPSPNRVLFSHPTAGATQSVVLKEEWDTAHRPTVQGNEVTILANQIYGQAATFEEAKNGNPTLSWEYWDGSAWWKIPGLNDGTNNLQSTGSVRFCVPEGLQETDVAGRTSHWIRARLIGGDYGKESVTIVSEEDEHNPKKTTQTVDRSLSGITPPQMVSIDLTYSVCCPSLPDFVLTRDGHAVRDQSAANRIDNASVELFVPLTETIRRAASGATSAGDSRRALYLGFDGRLEGGPIGVLFLVNEGKHDDAFPLEVEVLRERGFEPVIVNDDTRGLNESGILTFTLGTAPPAVALFGSDARYWLRVRPNQRFSDPQWLPDIRAAFLNGAWAFAAETQPLERLGSSDGSPNQRVFLARPPAIKGSLELRVLEPLGEEDVATLNASDATTVLAALPTGVAGPWVRWKVVDNLADDGAEARIYTLDHETGKISFGDGQHGKIPPVGVDSIVAVTYKRGGGEGANAVTAWSQVSLISAIQGVQTVAAPDGAAGGSGPQTAEEVIRFAPSMLSMRERALTLRDLESLAARYSRDVAQARAFPTRLGARLVVVMRGRDIRPSQSVRRELRRFLAERTPPMLAVPGAIEIREPAPVAARVELELTIDRIDFSGSVASDARRRVGELLDPATGGLDKTGWRLGEVPTDSEIAAVLASVPHLEEIRAVRVVDAATRALLTTLAPDALIALVPDGVTTKLSIIEGSLA